LGFLHRLFLLGVEVAEVGAPDQEFLFGHFFEQAAERVAKFFGDTQTK